MNAKNPSRVCKETGSWLLPTFRKIEPRTNPAMRACITLVAKSCLVLNTFLQNLSPSITTSSKCEFGYENGFSSMRFSCGLCLFSSSSSKNWLLKISELWITNLEVTSMANSSTLTWRGMQYPANFSLSSRNFSEPLWIAIPLESKTIRSKSSRIRKPGWWMVRTMVLPVKLNFKLVIPTAPRLVYLSGI